jgi:hypothetical protein
VIEVNRPANLDVGRKGVRHRGFSGERQNSEHIFMIEIQPTPLTTLSSGQIFIVRVG